MIVDGRAITKDLLAEVARSLGEAGVTPTVRALVVQPSPATESYLATKSARAAEAGMKLDIVRLPDTATTAEVLAALVLPGADSILVQLPLPDSINTQVVLDAIPLEQDADVLSTLAHQNFDAGHEDALLPPVVDAIAHVLERAGVQVAGKRAVVVGSGWLVGAPAASWLQNQGARVTVITREQGTEGLAHLKEADIIVSGAGSPGLIRPEHLSPGVILIDAGTSESGGAIVGDADPACASVASLFTPVPGGMGPIAVACLFRNAAELALRAHLHSAPKAV